MNAAYLPGVFPPAPEPLGRFLPPIPDGAVSAWLAAQVPPGAWVLDPFGTSPRMAVEIARQGYRVLVAANNPIIRFLLEMAAHPPLREELQISLAELASAYRGSERIEPHIRALYRTECNHCASPVEAEAFLWEHADSGRASAPTPYARIYTCPTCRATGEFPCTAGDINRARQFNANTLHRARALERVAPHQDPDRPYAEQALNIYLPRAVYALFTLMNKLEGLDLPPARRRHLIALLLHACEQGHALWKHPPDRERRYQLIIPPRFREQNIWLSLEHGLNIWSSEGNPGRTDPVPIITWPATDGESTLPAGIWVFEGRLKSLAETLTGLDIRAVCTTLPRPNRAFWSLSALWAGWFWGHDAVGPFRSVLRRQRYDWGWHTTALAASLSQLYNILAPGIPLFGVMGEFEPNYLAAALVSADLSGFQLDSLAIRPEINNAQLSWRRQPAAPSHPDAAPESIAAQAVIRHLEERGEPISYTQAISTALSGLAQMRVSQHLVPQSTSPPDIPADAYAQAVSLGKEILSFRHGFLRYPASTKTRSEPAAPQLHLDSAIEPDDRLSGSADPLSDEITSSSEKAPADLPESGLVWLRDASRATLSPLADRIELALVNFLLKHNACTLQEIDYALCAAFPALYTPDTEYLQVCLESYAELEPGLPGSWRLHPQDSPAIRRQDLADAEMLIRRLGERIGFSTEVRPSSMAPDGHPIQHTFCWVDSQQLPQLWLYPIVSAAIGEIILQSTVPPARSIIILPGGRANLVAYKLRRDPRLGRLCDPVQRGWRFIKFRHLRWLESNPLLSRENLNEQLALDPLTYSTSQLRLL